MRLIDNTVNLNELETFNIEIKGNKRIRTYYFINTFQQANNIMVEILNAININWKQIDPYKQDEGINIMKRLQQIQNLIYNIMETTPKQPLIDRVNTELLPLVQPRLSKDNTMDLIITLYDDGENIIKPIIPNVPDIITITQYTELIDHNDRSKLNKIKQILNNNGDNQ